MVGLFLFQEIGKSHHLTDEDKAKLAAARIAEEQHKDRGWYRVNATRNLFGGKSLQPRLNPELAEVSTGPTTYISWKFIYTSIV